MPVDAFLADGVEDCAIGRCRSCEGINPWYVEEVSPRFANVHRHERYISLAVTWISVCVAIVSRVGEGIENGALDGSDFQIGVCSHPARVESADEECLWC